MSRGGRAPGLLVRSVALIALGGLTACLWPVKPSPDCKRKMSDCEAACQEDPNRDPDGISQDSRTACQQRCDTICD